MKGRFRYKGDDVFAEDTLAGEVLEALVMLGKRIFLVSGMRK